MWLLHSWDKNVLQRGQLHQRSLIGCMERIYIQLSLYKKWSVGSTGFWKHSKTLVKTHTAYWNVMVACSHGGQTSYAHYLLGRFFKLFAIKPTIELIGTYIDALARKGQLDKAFIEVKCLIYRSNQEIFAIIFLLHFLTTFPLQRFFFILLVLFQMLLIRSS